MPKMTDPKRDSMAFAADLHPETMWPRIRFNFANGWAVSVALRTSPRRPCDAMIASVAPCPQGRWSEGVTELGETEASPEEVVAFLKSVSERPAL